MVVTGGHDEPSPIRTAKRAGDLLSQATQRRRRWRVRTAAAALTLIASSLTGAGLAQAGTSVPHLTLAANPLTVHVGSTTWISGTATPRVAGVPVYLQRFSGGHWVNLTYKSTSAKGSYAFAIRASSKPTTWIFRVALHGTVTVSHTVHVK